MDVVLLCLLVFSLFVYMRAEKKELDEQFQRIDKPSIDNAGLDPSEDIMYISAHETEGYVHLWQIEPGLNNKEIGYIGRFEKYNTDEYITMIKKFAGNKTVDLLAINPTEEFKLMVLDVYQKSIRGEI